MPHERPVDRGYPRHSFMVDAAGAWIELAVLGGLRQQLTASAGLGKIRSNTTKPRLGFVRVQQEIGIP